MSSALVWQITRNTSSFQVKVPNSGLSLSREPGNLYNKHCFKYSTTAQATKPVSIAPAADNKGAVVTLRKFKAAHAGAVKKAAKTTVLKKNARAAAKSVKSIVAHYRPDLQSAAAARVSRIIQSQAPVKAAKPAQFRGRAKKN